MVTKKNPRSQSKQVKYLGKGDHKTLMKKIEEDTKKWKGISRSRTGRINVVKMTILSKVILRFSAILIKTPMTFFRETATKKYQTLYKTTKDSK